MCGIGGVVGSAGTTFIRDLLAANAARGRDGFGIYVAPHDMVKGPGASMPVGYSAVSSSVMIFNHRAEPTPERVFAPTADDQQPYKVGSWHIVHNGTIANDKELREECAGEPPTAIDSWVIAGLLDDKTSTFEWSAQAAFHYMLQKIVGSFAIIAVYTNKNNETQTFYAVNYRPLQYYTEAGFTAIASVIQGGHGTPVPPYTWGLVKATGLVAMGSLYPERKEGTRAKALVVCSGGLDSTVAAAVVQADGLDVTLLHFDYGCRATGKERFAVDNIAGVMGVKVKHFSTDLFQKIGYSRLLDGSVINNGEAGAEQAIEWVPSRNTIMAAIACGIAEAEGFDIIVLGINLEEAGGGYTDNVVELYDGLNGLMHWIVGVGKKIAFVSPLGNLMKHEIVKLGLDVRAPMDMTWSCYNNGELHCGNCGPCTMRRTAFAINERHDPVKYLCDSA